MCTHAYMYEDDKKLLVGKPSTFPDRENSAADLFLMKSMEFFNIQLGYLCLSQLMY